MGCLIPEERDHHNHPRSDKPEAHIAHRNGWLRAIPQAEHYTRRLLDRAAPIPLIIHWMNEEHGIALADRGVYNTKFKVRTERLDGKKPTQATIEAMYESEHFVAIDQGESGCVTRLFLAHPQSTDLSGSTPTSYFSTVHTQPTAMECPFPTL